MSQTVVIIGANRGIGLALFTNTTDMVGPSMLSVVPLG